MKKKKQKPPEYQYPEEFFPFTIWLPGRVIPKARPRLSTRSNSIHLPGNYVEWKSDCIYHISRKFPRLPIHPILQPVSIEVIIVGFRLGDLDNIIGSIMDGLVDSDLLSRDNITKVPRITVEYQSHKTLKGAWISLAPFAPQKFMPSIAMQKIIAAS